MKLRRPSLVYISLMATSVGVFLAGAHLAANALIEAQRLKQLHELNEVALRRSEVAVDYGIIALNEVVDGLVDCARRNLVLERPISKFLQAAGCKVADDEWAPATLGHFYAEKLAGRELIRELIDQLSESLDKPIKLQAADWSSGDNLWLLALAGDQRAFPKVSR